MSCSLSTALFLTYCSKPKYISLFYFNMNITVNRFNGYGVTFQHQIIRLVSRALGQNSQKFSLFKSSYYEISLCRSNQMVLILITRWWQYVVYCIVLYDSHYITKRRLYSSLYHLTSVFGLYVFVGLCFVSLFSLSVQIWKRANHSRRRRFDRLDLHPTFWGVWRFNQSTDGTATRDRLWFFSVRNNIPDVLVVSREKTPKRHLRTFFTFCQIGWVYYWLHVRNIFW